MLHRAYSKTHLVIAYYIVALMPLLVFYVYMFAHWENVRLCPIGWCINYDPMQYDGSIYFDIETACMFAWFFNILVLFGNIISIIVKLVGGKKLERLDFVHMVLTGVVLFFTVWQYGYSWALE